jgi:hypothetical protein
MDYVSGLGSVAWREGRWFVTIEGDQRFARRRSGNATPAQIEAWAEMEAEKRERVFEVIPMPGEVDVITRQADEVTNAIADGFVRVLAIAFDGKADP